MNLLEPLEAHVSEIYDSLVDTLDFFRGLIRNINEITRDLFARGFQSHIPVNDIQACEDAEIAIKEITATYATLKVNIPDDIIHKKIITQREFEDLELKIRRILGTKVSEEIHFVGESKRFFEPALNTLNTIVKKWYSSQLINGYRELVYFKVRVLQTALKYLKEIYLKLVRINYIPVVGNFFEEQKEILDGLTKDFDSLKKLSVGVDIENELLKNSWIISKSLPVTLAKNPEYFQNPESIKGLFIEIPMRFKMEKMQRLITEENYKSKTEVLTKINGLIESLMSVPQSHLALLETCD